MSVPRGRADLPNPCLLPPQPQIIAWDHKDTVLAARANPWMLRDGRIVSPNLDGLASRRFPLRSARSSLDGDPDPSHYDVVVCTFACDVFRFEMTHLDLDAGFFG